jgi:hypothetical protein
LMEASIKLSARAERHASRTLRLKGMAILMVSHRDLMQGLVSLTITFAVMGAALFLSAGALLWPHGLTFLAAFFILVLVSVAWLWRVNPEIFAARRRVTGEGTKSWDLVLISILLAGFFVTLFVAGLDGGRFHWAPAPPWAVIAGYVLMVLGCFGTGWAQAVNRHFEPSVRTPLNRPTPSALQRFAASISQMASPRITAVSTGAPSRSAAAMNRSGSGFAYLTGHDRRRVHVDAKGSKSRLRGCPVPARGNGPRNLAVRQPGQQLDRARQRPDRVCPRLTDRRMALLYPLHRRGADFNARLAQELVGEQASAHADFAMNAPEGQRNSLGFERFPPGEDVVIHAVDKCPVEIEDEDGLDAHGFLQAQ